jgi:hypothetical protein
VDRRRFLLMPLGVLTPPLRSEAQPRAPLEAANIPRVVFVELASEQDSRAVALIALFRETLRDETLRDETLRDVGHVEGRTLHFEVRYLAARFDHLPEVFGDIIGAGRTVVLSLESLEFAAPHPGMESGARRSPRQPSTLQ